MFKSAAGLVTITLEAASATNTPSAAVDIVGSAVALLLKLQQLFLSLLLQQLLLITVSTAAG
jgi:hypothetical protein